MDRSLEQKFSDIYIANIDIIGDGLPARVHSARSGYLENFNLLSLPSKHDENYRHTDVRALYSGDWEQYFTPPAEEATMPGSLPVEGYDVDVVNGFCSGGVCRQMSGGIIYGSLRAAMMQHGDIVLEYYNSLADNEKEALVALNSVFMQDGAFVYVPRGVKADKPFVLNFEYSSSEQAQICFSRALIVIEDGAQADIIISHHDSGDTRFLVNFVRECVVGGGARLNLGEMERFKDTSALIASGYLRQQADSRVTGMNMCLCGGVVRINSANDLAGRGCESNHYALWLGTGRQRTDINMYLNHLAPACNSFQLVKGVVSGEAVGAFTGSVLVAQDAQGTVAQQQSRNLQMSETSKIYTEPRLEIYADDVKCSHGATVGQMDQDAILYMRQRGISENDARRLQMFGFVNDIISRCPHDGICDFAASLAQDRIAEL